MTRTWLAAVAAAVLAAPVWAQSQDHEKHHPGEPAAQPAPGTGGGMMGGGMMGGGMMGGGMMNPAMMQGGMMGHGMMAGGMMGRGMGHGALLEQLGLTEEQQAKVQPIHDEMQQKHWELMGKIMQERNKLRDALSGPKTDRPAAEAAFKRTSALREQMFAARLEAHAKLEAALSPEQRTKLRQFMRRGGWMMMH